MNCEFDGLWWTPGNDLLKIPGNLVFDCDQGGTLILHGGLFGENAPSFSPVIFGESKGIGITVLDARWRSSEGVNRWLDNGTRNTQYLIHEERWTCEEVIVGKRFNQGSSHRYSSFKFDSEQLRYWVRKPYAESAYSGKKPGLWFEVPEMMCFSMDDGAKITLIWTHIEFTDGLDKSILSGPQLMIEPRIPLTLREIEEQFLVPILFILGLATSTTDHLIFLSVEDSESERTGFGNGPEVLTTHWTSKFKSRGTRQYEHLIKFTEVESDLQGILNSWLSLYAKRKYTISEFFSIYYSKGIYGEDKFLRVMRSLESWHRGLESDLTFVPAEEYAAIRADIKSSLREEHRRVVFDKFNNDPTLVQRIDEIVSGSPAAVRELIGGLGDFVQRAVKTRNNIAHIGDGKNIFSSAQMFWGRMLLEQTFIASLLENLGFDQPKAGELLSRSEDWKYVASTSSHYLNAYIEEE